MPKLVAIVEGHGEVAALPILLRRIRDEIAPDLAVEFPRPIRRSASKLLNNPQELEKMFHWRSSRPEPTAPYFYCSIQRTNFPVRSGQR
jgi:hypothetical protein